MAQEPAVRERAGAGLMLVFCLIWVGINFTEVVSNQVLPLTITGFTNDPRVIGWILFLNPLFGFIAQPLVGWASDHIWTPVGRRAFFLITGAPIVAACLYFVPAVQALWQLVFLVFVYQFFQDVLNGSDHPLLADLIPPNQRTFLSGLMAVCMQLTTLFILRKAMVWWQGESLKYIYWMAACLQILFVCVAAFFLNEKKRVARVTRIKAPSDVPRWIVVGRGLRQYVMDVMGDPMLRRLAACQFLRAVTASAFGTYMVLFATQTMHLKQAEYSSNWGKWTYFSLLLAIPLSLLVEKLPKQKANAFGFLAMILAAAWAITHKTGGTNDIFVIAMLFGLGSLIMEVTFKPFMTEYFPREIIGKLSGAMNIFFATGRSTLTLAAGYLVHWFNKPEVVEIRGYDYSVVWYVAIVAAALNIVMILTVPDYRYEARKKGETVPETAEEEVGVK